MKKPIIMIIILLQILLFISCTSQLEKDALVFIEQMNELNLVNEYEVDSETYGIYLSENSETVYQYKYVDSNYYINVLEERSFSYFDDDCHGCSEARSIRNIFYVDTMNGVMYEYNFESSMYEELMNLVKSDIESMISDIHRILDEEGDPVAFTNMYPVIYEALKIGKDHGKVDAYGRILTFTVSIDTYLKYASKFKAHLLKIYGDDKYNKIINSMIDSPYKDVHLKFRWNLEEEVIIPIFQMFYRQIEYYKVEVFPSSFNDQYNFE